MHRYIPISRGYTRIGEKESPGIGTANSGSTLVNGYLDLATLWFTGKFGAKPMHFFDLLGSLMFIIGFIAVMAVGFGKLYDMTRQSLPPVTDSPTSTWH